MCAVRSGPQVRSILHEAAKGSSWTTPAPTPTRAHGRTLRSMAVGVQSLSSVSHHKGSLLGAHCLLSPFQKHRETKSSDSDDPLGALCVGTICVFVEERTEAWGWQVFHMEHWWGLRRYEVCVLPALALRPPRPSNGMSPTRLKTRGLSPPVPGIKLPSLGGMETGQHLTDGSEWGLVHCACRSQR